MRMWIRWLGAVGVVAALAWGALAQDSAVMLDFSKEKGDASPREGGASDAPS